MSSSSVFNVPGMTVIPMDMISYLTYDGKKKNLIIALAGRVSQILFDVDADLAQDIMDRWHRLKDPKWKQEEEKKEKLKPAPRSLENVMEELREKKIKEWRDNRFKYNMSRIDVIKEKITINGLIELNPDDFEQYMDYLGLHDMVVRWAMGGIPYSRESKVKANMKLILNNIKSNEDEEAEIKRYDREFLNNNQITIFEDIPPELLGINPSPTKEAIEEKKQLDEIQANLNPQADLETKEEYIRLIGLIKSHIKDEEEEEDDDDDEDALDIAEISQYLTGLKEFKEKVESSMKSGNTTEPITMTLSNGAEISWDPKDQPTSELKLIPNLISDLVAKTGNLNNAESTLVFNSSCNPSNLFTRISKLNDEQFKTEISELKQHTVKNMKEGNVESVATTLSNGIIVDVNPEKKTVSLNEYYPIKRTLRVKRASDGRELAIPIYTNMAGIESCIYDGKHCLISELPPIQCIDCGSWTCYQLDECPQIKKLNKAITEINEITKLYPSGHQLDEGDESPYVNDAMRARFNLAKVDKEHTDSVIGLNDLTRLALLEKNRNYVRWGKAGIISKASVDSLNELTFSQAKPEHPTLVNEGIGTYNTGHSEPFEGKLCRAGIVSKAEDEDEFIVTTTTEDGKKQYRLVILPDFNEDINEIEDISYDTNKLYITLFKKDIGCRRELAMKENLAENIISEYSRCLSKNNEQLRTQVGLLTESVIDQKMKVVEAYLTKTPLGSGSGEPKLNMNHLLTEAEIDQQCDAMKANDEHDLGIIEPIDEKKISSQLDEEVAKGRELERLAADEKLRHKKVSNRYINPVKTQDGKETDRHRLAILASGFDEDVADITEIRYSGKHLRIELNKKGNIMVHKRLPMTSQIAYEIIDELTLFRCEQQTHPKFV